MSDISLSVMVSDMEIGSLRRITKTIKASLLALEIARFFASFCFFATALELIDSIRYTFDLESCAITELKLKNVKMIVEIINFSMQNKILFLKYLFQKYLFKLFLAIKDLLLLSIFTKYFKNVIKLQKIRC